MTAVRSQGYGTFDNLSGRAPHILQASINAVLADYRGIRKGEHNEIELFGLYPDRIRIKIERSEHDKKPYR